MHHVTMLLASSGKVNSIKTDIFYGCLAWLAIVGVSKIRGRGR